MENIKQLILDQIELYEKMIDDNQNVMIKLQERIGGYKDLNKEHMKKIKELSNKLKFD